MQAHVATRAELECAPVMLGHTLIMYYPAIDADSILYKCGFAAQHKIYTFDGVDYKSAKDLKDAGHSDKEYTSRIEVEPVANAISNVRNVLESILSVTEAIDFTIYVSSNIPTFRDKLARIRPYKGNRPADSKPIHYDSIRDYIIHVWGAIPSGELESDDMCAIHQYKIKDSLIVTNDKDLYQVPGWHYNWTKSEHGCFFISDDEARHWKYTQILCGDATDNVEGIPGLGEAGAEKLLRNMFGATEEEYDEMCSAYYIDFFSEDVKPITRKDMTPKDYCKSLGCTPEQLYEETKQLITIRTKDERSEN